MQIIDRIEINYFRSVYNVSISKISDINVFIGANDAGKSNILRALNLFFNNESGYDEDLQFLQDVTHLRQEEARSAKGRLTIWIKIHFNNVEKWKTLPDKFFIKKSWNRYSDDPEVSSDVTNKQSLTKFQNKIRFYYVPAVKEKDIFSNYLNLLYETLSDKDGIEFSGPADALSTAVNASIIGLTDKIKMALSVKSNIQIPNDLESIFERLEFFTDQDSFRVPLSRRGDGLQVRHIPHILQYISQNNKGLNIWAYEEPENSLEMSNAFSLAKEFENEFSAENQIFITSHSPAFYSLNSKQAKRFLVKKSLIKNLNRESWISVVEYLENSKVADVELGVAELIAERSADAFEEIQRLKDKNEELSALGRPVVLTEGKTDAVLLRAAWGKLYPEKEILFEIASCDLGGADVSQENAGADELKKILESTTKNQRPLRIGLFDNDGKGNACFENLKKHKLHSQNEIIKINNNKKSAALKLPNIVWGSPYDEFISDSFCIEMMFPFELYEEDWVEFEYIIGGKKIPKERGEKWVQNFQKEPDLFGDVPFKIVPRFQNKVALAEKLEGLKSENFSNFLLVFAGIQQIIDDLSGSI